MTFDELAAKYNSLELRLNDYISRKQQISLPLDDTSQRIIREIVSSSGSGITLVESGDITTDLTISDLKGDTDGMYKLIVSADHSTAFDMAFQINGDTGANYEYLRHYSSKQGAGAPAAGTDFVTGATLIKTSFITQKNYICELNISALSGKKRVISSHCVGLDGAASYYDTVSSLGVWTNTADEITSITIKTGAITGGKYALFKL
jgi:hypothetical protein